MTDASVGVATPPKQQRKPTVDVIVVTYQSSAHIEACLSSLTVQVETATDVIVVDNRSTDGTADLIEARFPDVKIIRNDANVGFGRACNQALTFARPTRPVLYLNPDTVLPPHALASMLSVLEREPGVGIVGCKLVRPNGEVDHACRREIPTPTSSVAYMLRLPGLAKRAYTDASRYDEAGLVGAVNGAFMLVRPGLAQDLRGFDPAYWMYGEDLDLCVRALKRGFSTYYEPSVVTTHHKGASSGAARAFRVNWEFHRAMWVFYRKHQAHQYGLAMSAVVGFGIAARFAVSAFVSAARRAKKRLR